MIIWNLLIGPCLWLSSCGHRHRQHQQQLKTPAPVASSLLWAWRLAPLPRAAPLLWLEPRMRMWDAAGGCRQLIPAPLLPYTSHQPNWDCRSNLVKNGCCYCAAGCAFGFTVCWEHTWAGAGETMGREFWKRRRRRGECLFLALKRWQSSTPSSFSFFISPPVSAFLHTTLCDNSKSALVNTGRDIYLKIGVFTYNRH